VQYFGGGFFHQRKVRQPRGRQDSIGTSCLPKNDGMMGLDAFLYLVAQNFELLSKIQGQNKKINNLWRLMSFLRPI
jgi:hypothetical protein